MRTPPPVENVGSGIWSIPVPIPNNPLGYTLVYALETPNGPVLVDAGWEHEDSWAALTSGLAGIGMDVADVHGVAVTHFHPDHAGLAGRVRDASGAFIAMHRADIAVLDRIASGAATDAEAERARLHRAGASAAEAAEIAGLDVRRDPPARPDTALEDGELIDVPGRKLRTVWTPGHSPGHICLHLEDADHLFTGDHLLPTITPHIGLHPFAEPAPAEQGPGADGPAAAGGGDPLGTFLDSLDTAAEIGAAHALPAHEHRFDGIAGRAAAITAHHEEKLGELAALLAEGPHTLWELAAALPWKKAWSAMHTFSRRMAAAETAAHLRTLERRGRAAVAPGRGGVQLWSTRH